MARSTRTVFLDANVLAAPVTRTLLLVGIEAVDVVATWSKRAELEANRHVRSRAMSVTDLRISILEADLSPTGMNPGRFAATKGADRQILADTAAANAAYLVTNDVDDFAEADLVFEKIAAVNPDLFMALRFSESAYQRALAQLVASLNNPPKTIEQMHALIGASIGVSTNGSPRSTRAVSRRRLPRRSHARSIEAQDASSAGELFAIFSVWNWAVIRIASPPPAGPSDSLHRIRY